MPHPHFRAEPSAEITVVPAADPAPAPPHVKQSGRRRFSWAWAALAAGFAAVLAPYLLALGSPLRLFDDGASYLGLAHWGHLRGPHQAYPPGYPALLRFAGDIGLGNAWGFVLVNLILLTIAVGCVYHLCRHSLGLSPAKAALVCLAVLLTHVVSELTPELMSDVPYFGAAMLCLIVLAGAEQRAGRERVSLLIVGAVLAGAAISIRVAGLALLPAVLFVAVGKPRLLDLWRRVRRRRAATVATLAVALLALITVTVVVIAVSPYSHLVTRTYTNGGIGNSVHRIGLDGRDKLSGLGELALQTNCCRRASNALGVHNHGLVAWGFALAGVALVALCVLGWRARRRFGVIELFVLSTVAVVLVFPFGLSRFWIAALPFIFVYALFGLERLVRFRAARGAIVLYAIVFVAIGAAWLIQSARVSTSGRDFPAVASSQLTPPFAASYRVAFGEARRGDNRLAVPSVVRLLRLYEPLAQEPRR